MEKKSLLEQLRRNEAAVIDAIRKGNDVEIRRAPDGGIKVMAVRKQMIMNIDEAKR